MFLLNRLLSRRPHVTTVTDLAMDDAELAAVRDLADVSGDWQPVARMLRQEVDVDRRGTQFNTFAAAAGADGRWLDKWLADEPDAPEALTLQSWALVQRAWLARGGRFARYTPAEAFRQFHRILDEAEQASARALAVNPDEPVAWVAALWLAVGQQEGLKEFSRRWDGLRACAPHDRLGHNAALQYLCAKWQGSHEQMYAFARDVTDTAPAGSPLVVQIIQAHIEYALVESHEAAALWKRPDVRDDLAVVLRRWQSEGPHSHALALHDHSLLAFALCEAGMWEQAGELFETTNHRVYEYPWYYKASSQRHLAEAHSRAIRHRRRRGDRNG